MSKTGSVITTTKKFNQLSINSNSVSLMVSKLNRQGIEYQFKIVEKLVGIKINLWKVCLSCAPSSGSSGFLPVYPSFYVYFSLLSIPKGWVTYIFLKANHWLHTTCPRSKQQRRRCRTSCQARYSSCPIRVHNVSAKKNAPSAHSLCPARDP